MNQQEQNIYLELQASKMKKQINTIGLQNFTNMLERLIEDEQEQKKQEKLTHLLNARKKK